MVILAAVGEKQGSERIIETAHDLASAYGDELRVLHVIPQDDAEAHFEALTGIPEFRDFDFSVESDRAEAVAEELVGAVLDDYDADVVVPVGRIGEPARKILDVADVVEARYLVIGGRTRSPAGKAMFGRVTQSVVLNAEPPVVTVMEDE